MFRQTMPELISDPDIPARSREIRVPLRSGSYDMRSEKEADHEQTTSES